MFTFSSSPSTPERSFSRGGEALSVLQRDGLILLPTANLWQVATDARRTHAVNRLLALSPPSATNRPELIFSDRHALGEWFPYVHPRLDTLLAFHNRPVTMLLPATPPVPLGMIDRRGEVAVRLGKDAFCIHLCRENRAPLASCLAVGENRSELPTGFGRVSSDILMGVDHLVKRNVKGHIGKRTAVTVRMDRNEVAFL